MIHTLKRLSDGTYTALMIASSDPQVQQKVYYYESLILVRHAEFRNPMTISPFFTIVLMISPPFNGHIKNLLLLYHKVLEIFSNPPFIGSQIGFWGCGIILFWRPGFHIFKAKWGQDSGVKVCMGCGMSKTTIRFTRLSKNLGRDDKIEKPAYGPSFYFI